MSINKFLELRGGDVTDGSISILGSTISATNLDPSTALKTNASSVIISSNLAIADTNNLQTQLDSKIANPLTADLEAADFNINSVRDIIVESTNNVNTATIRYTAASDIIFDLKDGGGGTDEEGSTGVLAGGLITINANTTLFDISDGSGIIFNTATLTATPVVWTGLTGQSATYTGDDSFISIDAAGAVVTSSTLPTNADTRANIYLGQIVHLDQVNIIAILDEQMTLLSPTNQIRDFMQAIGELKISGNIVSSSSLLTVAKSAGEILKFGGNFINDVNNPHLPVSGAVDTNVADTFSYRWLDGSSRLSLTNIAPNEYDNGSGEAAPGLVMANQWSVQRMFTFSIGALLLQQAQFVYGNKADAIAAINTEGFVVEPELAVSGVLVGFLAMKGSVSDLSVLNDAEFLQAGKFGAAAESTTSGVTAAVNLNDLALIQGDGGSKGIKTTTITVANNDELNNVQEVNLLADSENNTWYGFDALAGKTANSEGNSVFGERAGEALAGGVGNLGNDNVLIGHLAGSGIVLARECVIIGKGANTAASEQPVTAVGYQALAANTGTQNTALGRNALATNVDGDANTALGEDALAASGPGPGDAGSNNVAVGVAALGGNLIGDRNVAMGNAALGANTSGLNSTAIGHSALLNSNADDNTALGHDALESCTGASNTAVGEGAGRLLGAGTNNICVGKGAGNVPNGAESNNIYIGHGGLVAESNTTRIGVTGQTKCTIGGIHNVTPAASNIEMVVIDDADQLGTQTIVGGGDISSSGNLTTGRLVQVDGAKSIADATITITNDDELGAVQSITLLQDALNNTTYGFQAHQSGATGQSTAFGEEALQSGGGTHNVACGFQAARNLAGAASNNCVAIGSGALGGTTTGSARNIAIGFGAGSALTLNNNNNVYLDNVGVAGESQHLRLGNAQAHCAIQGIWQSASLGSPSEYAKIDASGNLGTVTEAGFPEFMRIIRDWEPTDFLNSTATGWLTTNLAPLAADPMELWVNMRNFAPSVSSAVGFKVYIPLGVTSLTWTLVWRKETTGANGVVFDISANSALIAGSAITTETWAGFLIFDPVDPGTTENLVKSTGTFALSNWANLSAGNAAIFQLRRQGNAANDLYAGSAFLYSLQLAVS